MSLTPPQARRLALPNLLQASRLPPPSLGLLHFMRPPPFNRQPQPTNPNTQMPSQISKPYVNAVILVLHSSSGLPGSEAVRGLDLETGQGKGLKGGCLTTTFAEDGVSPWYGVSEDGLTVFPKMPKGTFCNEMSEDGDISATKDLSLMSYKAFSTLPILLQRKMADEWAKGYEVRTEWLDTDHSPFYSNAEEMAMVFRRAAGEEV
ncbi:hypothetical protein AC579_1512 [Pseudocercospora musae]|uniref:AB hydrolase-1 domain-containing protein n=1 Tax=Pseudocercospora musae TaxID=113226 RepID=A0A139IKA2_9PEZI|nr:hypothetical protein AC579_1512 [Pseudocercospora musae]